MNRFHFLIIYSLVLILMTAGCASLPETQTATIDEEDRVIFTIPNTETFSGRENEPRPDWKGWGAESFTVAPDGSFWIADTAVFPNRLLHYDPQGDLLSEVSLEDVAFYAYDIEATQDALWILDISGEIPQIVKMDPEGTFISSTTIPVELYTQDGMPIANGVFNLMAGENDELLIFSLNGYYQWSHTPGEGKATLLEALPYFDHTYQHGNYDEATEKIPVYIDGKPFELPPDFYVTGGEVFVGFNQDGSFALAGLAREDAQPDDYQVLYYLPSGELLGKARQRPQTFYKDWNHHLAFGPDGAVYQLLSNPDHSVQILSLGFSKELSAKTEILVATPTPMTPMLPSEKAETTEELAQTTLLAFFGDLSAGNYTNAGARFGGELDEGLRQPMTGESQEEYWKYVCTFLWCLPVAEITDVERVSADEYIFYTVFINTDGSRFEIGACCGGDPASAPPVWQFAYPVKKVNGEWKVMRPPLFTP